MHNSLEFLNNNFVINNDIEVINPDETLSKILQCGVKSVTDFCGEDYSEFLDISKSATLQRALKWGGLKLVSEQVTEMLLK